MYRFLSITLFLALAAVLFSAGAYAQATDANLVGIVTDPTGAAIPNAAVELENVNTGVKNTTRTDANGQYRFNNVPVGRYRVTATAPGFTAASLTNLDLALNRTSTANLTMQVGTLTTTVDVTEAAAIIDTTTAQVQSTYESRMAMDLPLAANPNYGGVLNLSLLGAGVASSGGVGVGIGPSIGGQRPRNNNFSVEGVDNNRKDITGPNVQVPNEAVAEFTVLQNQFSAEFGHSAGGQFNTVVKSGTNTLHGSIYDYTQNRNFNALDQAFARQGILENPRYDQNRLGATIGGPIVKNKLFYFGTFEYNPIGQASTPSAETYAPTAAGYQTLAGIPGISKTNLDVLRQYLTPAPGASRTTTVNGVTVPIGILPLASPNYINRYYALASGDYNISDRDQLRLRYIYNKENAIDTEANLPAFFTNQPTISHLASVSEFHNFTPNVTNEFRAAYNRFDQDVPAGDFRFPGLDMFPNIQISQDLNVQIGPDPNAPQFSIFNSYQLVDNLNWIRGNHTFKFGFDGRKLIAPSTFIQRVRGDYNYTTLERYLRDLDPDELAERNVGAAPYSGNQEAIYWFVNDNWRIRPNFTLNLGLRHEYTTVPYSMRLQSVNRVADVPGVLAFFEPKPQTKNFAPRVGFAYSPGTSGNTSIRAGFGLAYDTIFDNIGLLSLPPQFTSTIDVDPTDAPNFLANGGILNRPPGTNLTPAEARAATSSWIPNQAVPYSINWNFGIQRVFASNYTAEVRYVGTRGLHLLVQQRLNRAAIVQPDRQLPTYLQRPSQAQLDALPLTLRQLTTLRDTVGNIWRPYGFTQNITAFTPQGNSTYHGLQTELTRRYSSNMLFKAAYTWSHTIDDSTAEVFSTLLTPRRPQDFLNLRNDRSSSALDRRHRFSFSWIYDTPWFARDNNWFKRNVLGNFSFSGTYIAESPEYATVQSGIDSNLNGDAFGDRAIVNPAGRDGVGSAVTALTNSAGETVAYLANNPDARYIVAGLGAFPNAGRNSIRLRGINNFDLSVAKRINFTERVQLLLRADAFNAFNHPQFTPGSINNVDLTQQTETRNFLNPGLREFNNPETAFGSNPRVMSFTARFSW